MHAQGIPHKQLTGLLHPPVLHLLPFPIVLLALAGRRRGEGDAHHCRAVQAAAYGLVECVHVPGQEPLADEAEGPDFLSLVEDLLSAAEGHCRAVLKCE